MASWDSTPGRSVRAALFCEQAIEDKGGVLTLVRIVDQITVSVSGEDAPNELPPGATINTTLVVMLTPGQARGRQSVQVNIEHPDGSRHPGPDMTVHFTSGLNNGANLISRMAVQLSSDGLYLADILVNQRLVTRAPLEVRYQVTPPGIQVAP